MDNHSCHDILSVRLVHVDHGGKECAKRCQESGFEGYEYKGLSGGQRSWVGIHVTAKFGVIRKPLLNNFSMSTFCLRNLAISLCRRVAS
jgi:hypothetical protein